MGGKQAGQKGINQLNISCVYITVYIVRIENMPSGNMYISKNSPIS